MKTNQSLLAASAENAYTYADYMALMEKLVAEGKTTGPKQTESLSNYTRLNLARMNRLNKIVEISNELQQIVESVDTPQIWFILTEAWCGDAAQNIPVIAKAAAYNPLITIKLVLRDSNLELMDAYLTNGGRSIPKLIAVDSEFNELFTWGPRPMGATDLFLAYKNNPEKTYAELSEELQRWYNADKTMSMQTELQTILEGVLSDW